MSREALAYHEAGHAYLAWRGSLPFRTVSIVPDYDDGSAGHVISTWWIQLQERPSRLTVPPTGGTRDTAVDESAVAGVPLRDYELRDDVDVAIRCIIALYGGVEAGALLAGRRNHNGARVDYESAEVIAESVFSDLSDDAAQLLHQALRALANEQLRRGWTCVVRLADALLALDPKHATMDEPTAIDIMRTGPVA